MSDLAQVICPQCMAVNRVPAQRLSDSPKCGKCSSLLFQGRSLAVDGAGFDKHIKRGDLPVLVDFWAPWCGPCKAMAPSFEQVAAELEPRLRFLKVDTEQHQALATRYAIRSIPTLALFRGGREIDRQAGATDAATLKRWLLSRL